MGEIMEYVYTYLLCAAGVLISISVPILYGALPQFKIGSTTYNTMRLSQLRPLIEPVLVTAILSLIISLLSALIVLAAVGWTLSPTAALLAGWASDSTLQRLKDSKPETTPSSEEGAARVR